MLGRPRVDLETQRKPHKCILVSKCLNESVPPYLSDYFIKNCTIHTYNTTQRNDIHLPNPMLPLGKNTFRFSGAVLFFNTHINIKF